MTKEKIYEIQNKLIIDATSDAWINSKDANEDNIRALAYIFGVAEMTASLIEQMNVAD